MEPGAKVTVIVFTEETWWPSSNTLSECYNNVDVGDVAGELHSSEGPAHQALLLVH